MYFLLDFLTSFTSDANQYADVNHYDSESAEYSPIALANCASGFAFS